MNNDWIKLGLIFNPLDYDNHPKILTHSSNPIAFHLHENTYRIFFNGRDNSNRSSIGAFDFDIKKLKILKKFYKPFFLHGSPDSFFSHGVSIGGSYDIKGVIYILFMGWKINKDNKFWKGTIGRIKVLDHSTLLLDSSKPIINTDENDPFSLSYPYVLNNPNGGFDIWYGSTKSWKTKNGDMLHVICHGFSEDGHKWEKKGLALPYELGKFQSFSRPSVLVDKNGIYHMWYSFKPYKTNKYLIGYSSSKNGKEWVIDKDNHFKSTE